jgi:nucleoside-diphosphate-sugar epimerase
MRVLITGAAGNLGSALARHLLGGPHELRLLIHHTPLPFDLGASAQASVAQADLGDPSTLVDLCAGVDCIVHFAGRLFAPRPHTFLPKTNVEYVRNLVACALAARVRKFILISFPHVEGESTPETPATGALAGTPLSVHAQTRLAAEHHLFRACAGHSMVPISLRPGMIYGRGVRMIEAGRWLLRRHLLGVWRTPTWIHLLALPDFLQCVTAAINGEHVSGIYNLGDDHPTTLQEFADTLADYWGYRRPWRAPGRLFYAAAWCCEMFALLFRTVSPLTRDFIKIGMASYVSDTSRMKRELLPQLDFPSLAEGLSLL